MRWIRSWIKAFIIRTIVEDYRNNGQIRQILANRVIAGSAFQNALKLDPRYDEDRARITAARAQRMVANP